MTMIRPDDGHAPASVHANPAADPQPPLPHPIITDPARLIALKQTGLLDSMPEEMFDRAVRIATRITGRPIGLLSLVDDARQFFKAQVGLDGDLAEARGTPLSHSFCQHVVAADAPLVVSDARNDPRVSDNPVITDHSVMAYLGVPVHGPDGHALGALCVIDQKPHRWTETDLETLKDLSAMVETELQLRQTADHNDLLLHEMTHRMKNLFTLLGGMIRQEARDADDAEDLASQLQGRLGALDAAHSLILPGRSDAEVTDRLVSMDALACDVLRPFPKGQIDLAGEDVSLGPKAAVAFALCLHELATNAAKYGGLLGPSGRVGLSWRLSQDALLLDWVETAPLKVTESAGEGFGSRLLRMNIELQLGGTFEREISAAGARVHISVPVSSLVG